MAGLADFRAKHPEYNDMPDAALADRLYTKFYSDIPRDQFNAKMGVQPQPQNQQPTDVQPGDKQAPGGSLDVLANSMGVSRQPPVDTSVSVDNVVRSTARGAPIVGSFLDELNAATNATLAPVVEPFMNRSQNDISQHGEDWNQRYAKSLEMQRAKDKGFDQAHPYLSTGLQVAGGVAGGGAMLKAAPAAASKLLGMGGASMPGKIASSAASGAGMGLVQGFGEGQGDINNRLNTAAQGGVVGGGLGVAAPLVGAAVGKVAGSFMPKATVPTTADIKAQAQAGFKAADQAGLWIKGKSFGDFADQLAPKLRGLDPTNTPKAVAAFNRLSMARNQPLNLDDFNILREIVGDVANSADAGERRLGGIMKGELKNYISTLKPADIVAGDPKAAANALMKGISDWSRYKKSEMIDKATRAADLGTAATWSGGNIDNAMRQKAKAILLSEGKSRGFSPEEIAALEKVVRGSKGQNTLRLIGKLSPQGSGLMAMLGLGATVANPSMAAAPIAGVIAKTASDAISARNLKMASELIRRGAPAPKRGSPLWEAYTRLLVQAGGQGDIGAPISPKVPLQITVTRPANWDQANPQR